MQSEATKRESPIPTKERKLLIAASVAILIGMVICLFLMWRRSRHSNAWQLVFFVLLFLNSCVIYRRARYFPQPDTLTRLFPKPTPPSERP